VHRWYEESRARDVVRRRTAFASLAFACVYEPCQRVAGDLLIRAVNDGDEEVRLSACRGLALAGDAEHVQDLFALAIQADVLTRVVLTEHLRPHAGAVRGPIQGARFQQSLARSRGAGNPGGLNDHPFEKLCDFLEHRDRKNRLLAFRLASFTAIDAYSQPALLRALADADAGARRLAIVAVGRQKITEAIRALELCLESGSLEESRLAASALAAMPPEGWRVLDEQTASPNASTKLAAEARELAGGPRQEGFVVDVLVTIDTAGGAVRFAAATFYALLKGCFELRGICARPPRFEQPAAEIPHRTRRIWCAAPIIAGRFRGAPAADLHFSRHELVLVLGARRCGTRTVDDGSPLRQERRTSSLPAGRSMGTTCRAIRFACWWWSSTRADWPTP
jgi:hypothetical protein